MDAEQMMNGQTVPASGDTLYGAILPVSERDRVHRLDFMQYILRDAQPWHRDYLTRLIALWTQWNDRYYEGKLLGPYLQLLAPPGSTTYGSCSLVSGFGGKSQILLRPSLLLGTHPRMREGDEFAEGRFRFVADVLLHEQGHQYHQEVTGLIEKDYHGHGPAFRDVCNRIGADLGLPLVRTSKKRGPDKDLPSCAQWPHNVRPADYYLGAYVQPEQKTPEEEPKPPPEPTPDMVAELLARIQQARGHLVGIPEGLDLVSVDIPKSRKYEETRLILEVIAADIEKALECLIIPSSGDTVVNKEK